MINPTFHPPSFIYVSNFMHRKYRFSRFDLNYNHPGNQEIKTIAAFQLHAFVLQQQWFLSLECNLPHGPFSSQALLICRLQQSRPQGAVHFDGRSYIASVISLMVRFSLFCMEAGRWLTWRRSRSKPNLTKDFSETGGRHETVYTT